MEDTSKPVEAARTRTCTKCLITKDLDAFPLCPKVLIDGRDSRCKACKSEYRKANIEHVKEYEAKWRAENKDKTAIIVARYAKKTKEKRRAYKKVWDASNREKTRSYKSNRRARIRGSEGDHTAEDISELLAHQKSKCVVCRKDISEGYHIDHIQAISRGGSNDKYNLQLLCGLCNREKHAKDPIEFMQSRGMLI